MTESTASVPRSEETGQDKLQHQLKNTITRLNGKLSSDQLTRLSTAMPRVLWEFPDAQVRLCLAIEAAPPGLHIVNDCDDVPVRIRMNRAALEDAARGTTSLGAAFIAGRIHVMGLNPLRLRDFITLIEPLLSSFREACDEHH